MNSRDEQTSHFVLDLIQFTEQDHYGKIQDNRAGISAKSYSSWRSKNLFLEVECCNGSNWIDLISLGNLFLDLAFLNTHDNISLQIKKLVTRSPCWLKKF